MLSLKCEKYNTLQIPAKHCKLWKKLVYTQDRFTLVNPTNGSLNLCNYVYQVKFTLGNLILTLINLSLITLARIILALVIWSIILLWETYSGVNTPWLNFPGNLTFFWIILSWIPMFCNTNSVQPWNLSLQNIKAVSAMPATFCIDALTQLKEERFKYIFVIL